MWAESRGQDMCFCYILNLWWSMEDIWHADAVVNFSSVPCLFWTHHRRFGVISTRLPCRRPRASQQRAISMRDSSTRLLLPRWAHHSFWRGCHLYLPFYVSVRWLVVVAQTLAIKLVVWLRDCLPGHVPGSHISCECAHCSVTFPPADLELSWKHSWMI